jgi:hypothetical protein
VLGLRCAIVVGLIVAAGCLATDVAPAGTSSGTSSGASTTGDAINLDDCDALLTEADCADAENDDPGGCTWIEVRVPGAACESDAIVGQCVGLTYVGEGCQLLACSGPQAGDVDGFFRSVDGTVQVFESPECGLVAVDGWVGCTHPDAPAECVCLCPAP